MDRFKRIGWHPSQMGFVAYFERKCRIVFAFRGEHVFYILNGTESNYMSLGTLADLKTAKAMARKQPVIFAIANEALFRAKAITL